MLTRLSIRNIVLIEALDLDFTGGLGVLTGETGAGKSILLDAVGLVLGERADSGLVRAGEGQAQVTASFEFSAMPRALAEILDDAGVDMEPGEPLILRRQLRSGVDGGGGSKAFINDQPVGVALLRELAPHLVELHGQHDDRGLVNPRGHRNLLDRYAGAVGEAASARAGSKWSRFNSGSPMPITTTWLSRSEGLSSRSRRARSRSCSACMARSRVSWFWMRSIRSP